MNNRLIELTKKLIESHSLSVEEYEFLLENRNSDVQQSLQEKAVEARKRIYGNDVYIRGLIEISNYCKNNCYYCGIRRGNINCDRYRLTKEEILKCVDEGYELGFRSFVLQGGEDPHFTDELMCHIISSIKKSHGDCAVTLSLGERGRESFRKMKESGAYRYLLRHETADEKHYATLHPKELSLSHRLECLKDLKELGYQVGCGFMVGSPFQSYRHLAKDLKFIEDFKPDMCGIGPFIPHKDTVFKNEKAGSLELSCFLLSILRIIHPQILLPATTALGSISECGREMGILAGANVVMPNLSPLSTRDKYSLYDGKLTIGAESAQSKLLLEKKMSSIGYNIVYDRGDPKNI